MLRRPEPTNERVEPTILSIIAIEDYTFHQVRSSIAATNSMSYVA